MTTIPTTTLCDTSLTRDPLPTALSWWCWLSTTTLCDTWPTATTALSWWCWLPTTTFCDTWPTDNSSQLMTLTIHNHIMWHVTHWQQQSADDVETIHNHSLWHVTHWQQQSADDVDYPQPHYVTRDPLTTAISWWCWDYPQPHSVTRDPLPTAVRWWCWHPRARRGGRGGGCWASWSPATALCWSRSGSLGVKITTLEEDSIRSI